MRDNNLKAEGNTVFRLPYLGNPLFPLEKNIARCYNVIKYMQKGENNIDY